MESQLSTRIRCIRSDNGGEYCSKQFNKFRVKHGIQHQTIAPYQPQQNGLAERTNRSLGLLTLSMLTRKAEAIARATSICQKNGGADRL